MSTMQSNQQQFADSLTGARAMVVVPARGQAVWWVIAFLLGVIATALVMHRSDPWSQVLAQSSNTSAIGARGIYAFTGQISAKNYGLFMMDVDSGTVWCYELDRGATGEPVLKLVAARSWIFDRFLEEFNVADPIPSKVAAMVKQQRSQREDALNVTTAPVVAPGPALPIEPESPK